MLSGSLLDLLPLPLLGGAILKPLTMPCKKLAMAFQTTNLGTVIKDKTYKVSFV